MMAQDRSHDRSEFKTVRPSGACLFVVSFAFGHRQTIQVINETIAVFADVMEQTSDLGSGSHPASIEHSCDGTLLRPARHIHQMPHKRLSFGETSIDSMSEICHFLLLLETKDS